MAKRRTKRSIRKINPEKSNKMIYAVVAGLVLVFALFFWLLTSDSPPDDPQRMMEETLVYLDRTDGIIEIRADAADRQVEIVYDTNDPKDFVKITRYAAILLSNRLKGSPVRVVLFRNNRQQRVYSVTTESGRVLEETR